MTGRYTYDAGIHSSDGGVRQASGAWAYAGELAKYLPPDTVRVRVLDEYGYGPSLDACALMHAEHVERRESFRQASENLRRIADGSAYSRRIETIFGPAHKSHCDDMADGSAALLAAIERERGI